jgi:hypothetical protein
MMVDIVDSGSSLPLMECIKSNPVAYVYVFESNDASSRGKSRKTDEHEVRVPIYPNDAFYLGRNPEIWY